MNRAKALNIFTSVSAHTTKHKPLIAVKDNICTRTLPTTCSSNTLSNYTPPFDATVISLLSASYDVVGKTNMDEFGMGASTTNSHYGPTYNPLYDDQRICGGSSGGSAAAVAAGVCSVALGTDTGGSVRQPASYTGVLGFKPSYGRVSRWGVVAYAQSLDTVGIIGESVAVVKDVFSKIDQFDQNDPTSLSESIRDKFVFNKNKKLRIGIPEEYLLGFDPIVTDAYESALAALSKDHEVVPVSIPLIKYALPVYFTLAPAEASSNLARYDGIRYGTRADDDKNHYGHTRHQGFGSEVKRRIMLGNYNLNADSYQNHFLKAKTIRQHLRMQFDAVFKHPNHITNNKANPGGVDFLLAPTTVGQAPTMEEYSEKTSVQNYVEDVLTIPASLVGIPAISFPWGEHRVGLQLMGQYGDDLSVLDTTQQIMSLDTNQC